MSSDSVKQRLLVFAKYPRAGQVKTRLVPPLTYEEAEELFRAFLLDAIDSYTMFDKEIEPVLYVAGEDNVEAMQELINHLRNGVPVPEVRAQRGKDLGERMENAFAETFAEGYNSVCVIGTDHPTLPREYIMQAFAALQADDLVLGLAEDGGYYLLGMKMLHRELFRTMPWSTASLYRETMTAAAHKNLQTHQLPEWYDVDDAEDLQRLICEQNELEEDSHTAVALRHLEKQNEFVRNAYQSIGHRTNNSLNS